MNDAVLKSLSLESNKTKFIIVPITNISKKYYNLILDNGINVWSLESVYNHLKDDGINPFYWKATNMYGHWNHTAHNYIGNYLALKIFNLLQNYN